MNLHEVRDRGSNSCETMTYGCIFDIAVDIHVIANTPFLIRIHIPFSISANIQPIIVVKHGVILENSSEIEGKVIFSSQTRAFEFRREVT